MKIFIPFRIKHTGGVKTFTDKFKAGLEKEGHEVFFDFQDDYDVLFLIVQCPFKYILHAKRNKKKIIQRLDGCWYWTVSGWKYWLYNLKAKIIYIFFADYYVFQSQYSKYCCQKFLGKIKKPYSIIYNGVDLDLFKPEGEKIILRDNANQKIFFTASSFRRNDQIIPILNALEIYKEKFGNDFKFIVAGKFTGETVHVPEKYKSYDFVSFLGEIKNNELPKYERAADAFLFTHLNPPCPNNVIEAMACGLPICGIADGSMPELVDNGRNGFLTESSGNAFWRKRNSNLENFAVNMQKIAENDGKMKDECRKTAENRFGLAKMIENYLNIIKKIK